MPDAGESVPESAAGEALELDAKLELARDGTKRYVRELPYFREKVLGWKRILTHEDSAKWRDSLLGFLMGRCAPHAPSCVECWLR